MMFKELSKGKIFTFMQKDGHTETAIKSADRHALILQSGEEVKIHLTKLVEAPAPMRGGEFALDVEGRPMIVERAKNGSYSCDYIQRVGRGVLAEGQVSVISLRTSDSAENRNELYITLKRLEKALKNAKNALETGKDIVEDMK